MTYIRQLLSVLVVTLGLTGCSAMMSSSPQGFDTNRALSEAKPVFMAVRHFRVSVTPLEANQLDLTAMTAAIAHHTELTADRLDLPLSACSECPSGSLTIDFRQHHQGSIMDAGALGNRYTGTLYLVQADNVLEKITIGSAPSEAALIEIINTAVATRLVKTACVQVVNAYQYGHISDKELASRVESFSSHLNQSLANK